MQGFVEEAVIDRILASMPTATRLQAVRCAPVQEDMVLSSGEDDYAGWHGGICPRMAAQPAFSVPLSLGKTTRPSQPRRADPPEIVELGLEPSYRSGHRWWLASIAGAVVSLVFATLLLSISMGHRDLQSDYVLLKVLPAQAPAGSAAASESDPTPTAPQEITSRTQP